MDKYFQCEVCNARAHNLLEIQTWDKWDIPDSLGYEILCQAHAGKRIKQLEAEGGQDYVIKDLSGHEANCGLPVYYEELR